MPKLLHTRVALVLSFIQASWCSLTNVTVDDDFGDPNTHLLPTYSPETPPSGFGWKGQFGCTDCPLYSLLDRDQVYDASWHQGTSNSIDGPYSIEINFTGVAVYTYFILLNQVANLTTTMTNVSFTLDGDVDGTFEHIPTNSTDIQYNTLVYTQESLESKPHRFLISTIGTSDSLILFDYLIYTMDDTAVTPSSNSTSTSPPEQTNSSTNTRSNPSNTPSKSSKAAIIGGLVAGGIVLLTFILLLFYIRRRRRSSRRDPIEIIPYNLTVRRSPQTRTVVETSDSKSSAPSHSDRSRNKESSTSNLDTKRGQKNERREKRRERKRELVGRLAWLENRMDHLQGTVERQNDRGVLPEYDDVIVASSSNQNL